MTRGLSRRTVLRGALGGGAVATLGLPLLDAMTNLGGTAHADGSPFPQRFAVWFWGNGTHPHAWAPATTGTGWQAAGVLRGLAGLESKTHVISGTRLPILYRNNTHVEGATAILTGGNPVMDPSYTGSGGDWNFMTVPSASADELVADRIGQTRYRSLILAVTPLHGVNGPGTAVRYTSHAGPYAYNAPTYLPEDLFERLFGPSPPDPDRASVLDAVLEDAAALSARLGATDRARLDQHMDAIRDLELRVRLGDPVLTCTPPGAPPSTSSYRERARLFAELVAMAFVCDLTRVVSMAFSSPASHASYPDIFSGALLATNGLPTSFHEYEHQWGYDSTVLTGITYFHDVFGDFLRELDAVPEGGGTVLDHALVLGTSEVAGGAGHSFDDYPLFLAGGANGRLGPGAHHVETGALASRGVLTAIRAVAPTFGVWGSDQFTTSEAFEGVFA